mmetsp:Transcript_65307/g.120304  ORF Transcript_65307/g.120304 Transcript_65307/m.120304 type:complete len:341 (-) Transcript_65307:38-1060(-)
MASMRCIILVSSLLALSTAQQCASGDEKCVSDEVWMLQVGVQARLETASAPQAVNSGVALGPVFERSLKNFSIYASTPLQSASLAEHSSSKGCSCTWNPAYPCQLNGACYSYSTAASCTGAGGAFCGDSSSTPTCTCTWNDAYKCQLDGQCWGYPTSASCAGAGGEWCDTSSPSPTPTPTPTPAPTPTPSPSSDAPSDLKPTLDQHNIYRKKHQAPDLTWDDNLMQKAQSWADNCEWEHSTMGYGENLWTAYGVSLDPTKPVKDWYDEIKDYDFNNPGFSSATGHFTQVVWKSTTKVGCAVTKCSTLKGLGWSDAWMFVCEYSPPGNYQGQFATNVLPAK